MAQIPFRANPRAAKKCQAQRPIDRNVDGQIVRIFENSAERADESPVVTVMNQDRRNGGHHHGSRLHPQQPAKLLEIVDHEGYEQPNHHRFRESLENRNHRPRSPKGERNGPRQMGKQHQQKLQFQREFSLVSS